MRRSLLYLIHHQCLNMFEKSVGKGWFCAIYLCKWNMGSPSLFNYNPDEENLDQLDNRIWSSRWKGSIWTLHWGKFQRPILLKIFLPSFIHWFKQFLFSSDDVYQAVMGTGDETLSKEEGPCSHSLHPGLERQIINKQRKIQRVRWWQIHESKMRCWWRGRWWYLRWGGGETREASLRRHLTWFLQEMGK